MQLGLYVLRRAGWAGVPGTGAGLTSWYYNRLWFLIQDLAAHMIDKKVRGNCPFAGLPADVIPARDTPKMAD